jgi:peptidoglycan/xylan/chitin deacetylase (PgdA/CDA1 family)
LIKKFAVSFLLTICLITPVYAAQRTWEWAVEPVCGIKSINNSNGLFFWDDGHLTGVVRAVANPPSVPAEPTPTPGSKTAYITIDDGPSRNNTPAILDILAEYDIKATFFVLPQAGNLDDIFKRIHNEGHELANHSYSHDVRKLFDPDDFEFFEEDIKKAHEMIVGLTGHIPTIFRFPGGSGGRAANILAPRLELLEALNYRHFNWDVTTGDTDTSPAGKEVDVLVNNVILNTLNRRKLIILMHDTADKTSTVQALPMIIEALKEMGYTFDTLVNY